MKNKQKINLFDIYYKDIEKFNCSKSFKDGIKLIANRCKLEIEGIKGKGDNA